MTGKNRDLQRITVPYANLLGITDDRDMSENTMVS